MWRPRGTQAVFGSRPVLGTDKSRSPAEDTIATPRGVASNITTDRINDIDVHAIVEHCHAHADESLPQGVLAAATSNLLDLVASCSTVAVSTLMPTLRRFVRASCGGV